MRKVIISAIVVLSLALSMGAYGVTQDGCCGNASGTAGNMSMGGCCGVHNDMIAIMASMIDVQKDIIATLKDGPKKQELQKKVTEMENLLKQAMREQNSQNCCGGGMMMQNMPMQNMPMKNMPMQNTPATK